MYCACSNPRAFTCTTKKGACIACPQLKMSSQPPRTTKESDKGSKKDPKAQAQRQKGADGGATAEGSGASAKEAKEAKKRLKAERRVGFN